MKKKLTNKYVKWGLTALIVLILAICFVCLIFKGDSIWNGLRVIIRVIMPVIDGLIIAFIATPVLNWIEEKLIVPLCGKAHIDTKKPKTKKRIRACSVLLTFLFIGYIIYAFFAIVIPQIMISIQNITASFPTYINNLIALTEKLLADNPEVEKYIEGLIATYSKEGNEFLNNLTQIQPESYENMDFSSLSGISLLFLALDNNILLSAEFLSLIRSVSSGMIGALKTLYNLIIGLIISLYILSGKERFASQAKKICYALFERHTANQIIRAFRFTNKTFIGFLGGKIVDSAIIGVLCFAGTSVLKMPYPVLISVIVGVTNIIPFFGPYIGAIPSASLILVTDPRKCIPFIIFVLVLQQLDGNVIGPKILGESTGLTGFWVIFSITLFGGLWGIAGMVVGVPLFAVFYAGINYMVNKSLKKKTLSTNTEDYEKLKYIDVGKEYILIEKDAAKPEDSIENNNLLNNSQSETAEDNEEEDLEV